MQIDTPEQNLAFAMANKPASGTSSTASKNSAKVLEEDKEPSVIDEIREKGFMAYVEEIHAKRMEELRSKILEAMGLNEEQLAEMFARFAGRGVHCVLSNSDTPFIRKLYKGFNIETVYARRAINSRADRRGPVGEVLVSSC